MTSKEADVQKLKKKNKNKKPEVRDANEQATKKLIKAEKQT